MGLILPFSWFGGATSGHADHHKLKENLGGLYDQGSKKLGADIAALLAKGKSDFVDGIAGIIEKRVSKLEAELKARDERIRELEAQLASGDGAKPKGTSKALIGIRHVKLPGKLREKVGKDGVLVSEVVEGSPAAAAGIQKGDVIVAVGGKAVSSSNVRELLSHVAPGDSAEFTLVRDGKELKKSAVAVDREAFLAGDRKPAAPEKGPVVLGVTFSEDLVAEEVEDGFTGSIAGLKKGDKVSAINGEKVEDLDRLADHVSKLRSGDKFSLTLVREGKEQTVAVIGGTARGSAKLAKAGDAKEGEEEAAKKPAHLGVDVVFEEGVKVVEVIPGTAASNGGLKVGDLIKTAAGVEIKDVDALKSAIAGLVAGDTVNLVVQRGKESLELFDLKLGAEGESVIIEEAPKPGALGIIAEWNKKEKWLFVKVVNPNSAAEKANVRTGDVLISVRGQKVTNFDEMDGALEGLFAGDAVKLVVKRGGERKEITVTLGIAGV